SSELPAAAHRGGDGTSSPRDPAGIDALVPRAGAADHGTVARPADLQRLPVPALGQVLDQLLSGPRAPAVHPRHQPGGGPAARHPQPEAAQMSARLFEVQGLRTHFFTKAGLVKAVDDVTFGVD